MAHLMRVRFLPEPEVRLFTARTTTANTAATAASAASKGPGDSKKADSKEPETKEVAGERVQQVAGILERAEERGTSRVLLDSLIHIHPAPALLPVPRVLKLVWPASAAATVALHFALYDTGRGKARLRLKPRLTRGRWSELDLESLQASLCLFSDSQTHRWTIRQFDLSRGYSFTLLPGPSKVFKLTVEILVREARGQACRDMDLRRRVFKEVDLKRRLLAGMVTRRKCCDCRAVTFPRNRAKVQEHPEEEVEVEKDEEDRWWEEAKLEAEAKTKDAATDPWEWRAPPEEKEEKEAAAATTLEDFADTKGFEEPAGEGEETDLCNFDLDLYSGDF